MIHLLPTHPARIDDGAKTVIRALFHSKAAGDGENCTKDRTMGIIAFHKGLDMNFGNYQEMHRGDGMDVVECQYFVILVDFLAGNRSADDLAENAARVFRHVSPL